MNDLKTFRQNWNNDQKRLRELFSAGEELQEAKDLFYSQHAVLHTQEMSGSGSWSYADRIFQGISEVQFRLMPDQEEHSLIWILWHISRIEDLTMNILIINDQQVYCQDEWKAKLNAPIHHTGNVISKADLRALNRQVDPELLVRYWNAVGRQTRKIVRNLSWEQLNKKPTRECLDRIMSERALLQEAKEINEYWSRRKIFQLLLMPPTRHLMTHLNEAYNMRRALGL